MTDAQQKELQWSLTQNSTAWRSTKEKIETERSKRIEERRREMKKKKDIWREYRYVWLCSRVRARARVCMCV